MKTLNYLIPIALILLSIYIIHLHKTINQKESEISDNISKINFLNDKISNLENALETSDRKNKELANLNRQLESELITINYYSEKRYVNGNLVESHKGMVESLKACKEKVEDLEDQLRRCN